jgi:hypothetical protein
MKNVIYKRILLLAFGIFVSFQALCQGTTATARLDTRQISIGDQARLFLEVTHSPKAENLQWPVVPDSFGAIEVVERGKIDTVPAGDRITYRQRIAITGFDSGLFKIPPFQLGVMPVNGTPYLLTTDSFELMVQSVAVDTTQGFKPIKNIIYVKGSWLDYIWYIVGGWILLGLLLFVLFKVLKKPKATPAPPPPAESLTDKTMRLLAELDAQQVWQKGQIKEYYIQLSEIVRGYIEQRFSTPALELTTDELLYKAQLHRELQPYQTLLATILQTADLAKFAKWQPQPQEHFDAMENAKSFVATSRPVTPVTTEPTTEK